MPGASRCELLWVPMAGQAGARLAFTVTPMSLFLLGRRLARLGPCQVSYTLLVKGTFVMCGARMGTLVTLTYVVLLKP